MILQIILVLFLIFALSRVWLQLKENNLTVLSFLFWVAIFISAIFGIIQPEVTTRIARFVGIGRGADVVIYFSIVALFYLLFRLYIYVESLRHEISEIISQLSLKEDKIIKNK